jgi:hypothetical protein
LVETVSREQVVCFRASLGMSQPSPTVATDVSLR